MEPTGCQFSSIYQHAEARYQEITDAKVDAKFLRKIQTIEDLVQEIETQNDGFKSFREYRGKLFSSMRLALHPIETLGNMAAGGASTVFAPSSVVFGAVTYLIDAAKGVSSSYDAIEELMKSLKEFTVRLKIYSQERISEDMSERLIDVLVTLMEIFALSTREMRRGRLRKFGRNVLLGNDDAISAAVAKLDKLTQVEGRLVQAETLTVSKKTGRVVDDVATAVNATHTAVQETGRTVDEMSAQMTEVNDKLDNLLVSVNEAPQPQSDILRYILGPSQPDSAQTWYDRISKTRIPGTGDWIVKENMFRAWIKENNPTLLVSGIPGAGKSYLAATMIDFLNDQFAQSNEGHVSVSVAYFFFKDDNPDTRSVHQALRDLAYQISMTNTAYQKHVRRIEDSAAISTIEAAWRRLFVDFFLESTNVQSSAYIIIDGIDEADDEERRLLFSLARDIQENADSTTLRLAFIGRPHMSDQLYESLEAEVPTIHVTMNKNAADVERYIKASIQKSMFLRKTSVKLRQEILATSSSRAEGMFLWVNLMMQELIKCRSEAKIRNSLKEAPRGLKEMVRRILASFSSTCEPEELGFLNELLLWTACSPKPLILQEANDILRLTSPEEDGMIYLEGALRRQFASFFSLNRWDNLNTAELEILAIKESEFEERTDTTRITERDEGDEFEDVTNFVNFNSSPDTTLNFCHASIGDFFRDESEGQVTAGQGYMPVGVNWRDGKVYVLKTCLRLITQKGLTGRLSSTINDEGWILYHVVTNLSHHLQSTPPSYAAREDRSQIASMLVKLFSIGKVIKMIFKGESLSWISHMANLQSIWKWWENPLILDTLDADEQNFIADARECPAKIFKLAAVCSWKDWFGRKERSDEVSFRTIWHYQRMLKNEKFDLFDTSSIPTVDEVLCAANFQASSKTAAWHINVSQVLGVFNHMDACVQYSKRAMEIDPEDPDTWGLMGEVYIEQKKWHEAIEMLKESEKIHIKTLERRPNDKNTKEYLHRCLYKLCIAYSNIGDAPNRLIASQKSFELDLHCEECITSVLFHLHLDQQYENYISFMRRMAKIPMLNNDWTQLDQSINERPWPRCGFFRLTASSAFKAKDIPFMIDAWSSARSVARKESETARVACLDLCLARIYKEFAHDKAKAISIWENVFEAFVDTKDDGFPALIKVLATNSLAIHFLSEAIDAGVGTPEAEPQLAQLERLSARMKIKMKSSFWADSYAQFFAPGVYYRLAGEYTKFQAYFKPVIKRAVEILSDDDPGNDREGLVALLGAMIAAGDSGRVIALSYSLGHYDVHVEGKWWQFEQTNVIVNCDGPCCVSKPVYDDFSFCPICYDYGFCENCVELLREGKLGIDMCSPRHVDHFVYVPRRPQDLELKKSQMFKDGDVVDFSEWLADLKKQWNL
ncbi:hypothetical protein N7456_009747 [Penicillium angulare]|uniref:Fungal STAND N-terminal Goodbye domain-containing protein n=1 Tax=Penicillium angulare TaxID=116970 RepID=A0A9W9K616_9EURO|nr:hypothetical protein N7456_009747 [Penicillium angulare]